MRSVLVLAAGSLLAAADRPVDPTFLYRSLDRVAPAATELTSGACRYKPLFGVGDANSNILRGVARYGQVEIDGGGASGAAQYPREEQVWVVLDGAGSIDYGGESFPLKKDDFFYIAPGVKHSLRGNAGGLKAIVMGFKIPASMAITMPPKFAIANLSEVKKQVVGNHPPSTLYQLMVGDTKSTRDRLATGHVMVSLYVMEFAPGGTNAPHHHDREEEIYLLLDGSGEMVAGGGADGLENRRPAKAGDAYFFRLNSTVGFYNNPSPSAPKAHILAVRSTYPFGR